MMTPWKLVNTPEEAGLSSRAMLDLLDAAKAADIQLHSVMVIKDDKLAVNMHFAPHTQKTPHICYSVSKPFTSAAAGFAVAEGLLRWDDRVIDVLCDSAPANPDPWLAQVTLHHLLSMSSGLNQKSDQMNHVFDPDGAEEDWAKNTLAWGCDAQPGSIFRYNSHGSYLISCMVQKATGMTVLDYLMPRLFEPLGIARPRWDMSPQGVCCGGWGLYLPCEDIAKFGVCLLQEGKWNGTQVLPQEWLDKAIKEHIATNTVPRHREWSEGYGYHLWRSTNNRFRGDGSNGQFCIVSRKQNMIVAATADTQNLTGEHDLFDEFIFNEARWTPASAEDQQTLLRRVASLHI
ncbi:MAG: serine hydrolase [Clostridia bacterium]|nr:serine hydrolase [Clostridia bacterium]